MAIFIVFYNNNGFIGLEDLVIWLFLTKDLFDLPGAGGKSFLWPGGTLATLVTLKAQREGRDSRRLRQAKVTDTRADQSGCRESLRVGGTGLCTLGRVKKELNGDNFEKYKLLTPNSIRTQYTGRLTQLVQACSLKLFAEAKKLKQPKRSMNRGKRISGH